MVQSPEFSLPPTEYYGQDCYCYRSWEKSRKFTIKIVNTYCSYNTKTSQQILPSDGRKETRQTTRSSISLTRAVWDVFTWRSSPRLSRGGSSQSHLHTLHYLHPHIITPICKEFPNLLFKFNMLIHSIWHSENIPTLLPAQHRLTDSI